MTSLQFSTLPLERAAVRDAPPLCILILAWAKYYDRIPAWLVAEVFPGSRFTPWYLPLFTETDGIPNILRSLS